MLLHALCNDVLQPLWMYAARRVLLWTLRFIIPDMLCWSADSKWAGADNWEWDRSQRLWFMTVWVWVQTIVESVRSFPRLVLFNSLDCCQLTARTCGRVCLGESLSELYVSPPACSSFLLFWSSKTSSKAAGQFVVTWSVVCVHNQTAVTSCPPLPPLCNPGLVSPFTL